MNALHFHLHLLAPLLIVEAGSGDPNTGVGLAYIPGSAIRGALIGRYLQGRTVDALDPEFRRLFLSDKVRFLNGYPLASNGQRMLPTPRSWQQPKDAQKGDPAQDWAWGKPPTDKQQSDKKQWKGVDAPFCTQVQDQKFETCKPVRQVNIHIARQDRQRPTGDGATIFRYDALAEGQTFGALITAETATDLQSLRNLLGNGHPLNLGHSQSAGYGWVEVRYPTAENPKEQGEAGTNTASAGMVPSQLVVTLLSHALVQDNETGAWSADLTPMLGLAHTQAFAQVCMMAGFNRKWNLPLPQTQAIVAGSVFVYPYTAKLAEQLTQLAQNGIGVRRNEGFGQIAVNWNRTAEIVFAAATKPSANPPVDQPTLTGTAQELAKVMVERMLRQELDRALLTAINSHPIKRRGLRNAQLARLRVQARQAMAVEKLAAAAQAGQIASLVAFLGQLKEAARQQWQRARVEAEPLLDWVLQLATRPGRVWALLQATALPMPAIGAHTAQLTDRLAVEYTLRLLDGVAQLASRGENHE